jgi:hypothetical protein
MLKSGNFDEKMINDWLESSYSSKNPPALSVPELTNMLNNRILQKKIIEMSPDCDLEFDLDYYREYIEKVFINREDKIDIALYSSGKNISMIYNLDPAQLSGFFFVPNEMKKHLLKCLAIEQIKEDNELITESIQKSVILAMRIMNTTLARAKKHGRAKKSEVIMFYIRDEDTGEIRPLETIYQDASIQKNSSDNDGDNK